MITLYIRTMCPFCRKVLNYLEKEELSVKIKDLSKNPEYIDELENLGGKTQVPCLVHEGEALYESDDIIEWLKRNKSEL